MTLAPLDVIAGMRLEDGRRWAEVAEGWQVDDARAVFESKRRWHWWGRPRGGSKTTDAAGVAIGWLATEAPAGARGYVAAVDQDQAALLADAASGVVDRTPALAGVIGVQSLKLVGSQGATVEILSADGASAFGLRPHLLIVDEFAQWPTTRGARRLWTALLSAMAKVPGSRLLVATSAGEPSHPSHAVLEEARRSERWRVSEVPGPLPWIDPAELEAQRPLLRESEFARLHLNQWTQSEDRLVSDEDLAAACVLDGPQEPRQGARYVVTLDVGLTNDACVAVVAHAEKVSPEAGAQVRVVVDRLARWQGSKRRPVSLAEVEDWVAQASVEYGRAPLHADPYQAVGSLQRLRARGVVSHEFTFSAQSVGRVANALHLALRNQLLWLPDDEQLRSELGRVRLRESAPGVVRLDHDAGQHDDQAVAIGIAVSVLLERSSGPLTIGVSGGLAGPRLVEADRARRARPVPSAPLAGLPAWQRRLTRKALRAGREGDDGGRAA